VKDSYFNTIVSISYPYLEETFSKGRLVELLEKTEYLKNYSDKEEIIEEWTRIYIDFVKKDYQNEYKIADSKLVEFLDKKDDGVKIIWGNCFDAMQKMKSESIHLMVTSPPYYNAREYSQWKNLNDYLNDMRLIVREAYRVLDNHRVFVFNVGDIFDNDNITTQSTWGKRRIPLGAYFTKIFEEGCRIV
jgi:hypothetical protein